MRFEERAKLARRAFHVAGIADAFQLVAEGIAFAVGAGKALFEAELAAKNARTNHRRREARALFVGPGRDFNRRVSLVIEIVQCAHHF